MRVTHYINKNIYSSHFYYIRGDWNAIDDVNTLIDVGTDNFVVDEVAQMNGGVGKKRVEQVILTHEHFDHAGGLKYVIEKWNPIVYGYKMIPGVTHMIKDGMTIKIGDREATLLHTPGHSHDSVCIYVEEEQTIFVGDTAYNIKSPGGSYSQEFIKVLERISSLKIKTLYSGHDDPVNHDVYKILQNTLTNVKKSHITV